MRQRAGEEPGNQATLCCFGYQPLEVCSNSDSCWNVMNLIMHPNPVDGCVFAHHMWAQGNNYLHK